MALTKFGFIVTGAGLDPSKHRIEMKAEAFTMIVIGVPHPEHGIAVARELFAEGIQLLELCGGFGPLWAAKVIEAIDNRIPVGSVTYGPEAINGMHALFG